MVEVVCSMPIVVICKCCGCRTDFHKLSVGAGPHRICCPNCNATLASRSVVNDLEEVAGIPLFK